MQQPQKALNFINNLMNEPIQRKMKIPKKLKIGAQIYKILFVHAEDIENGCGEVNAARNIIKLRKDMPTTATEETLLHEIIHAVSPGLSEAVVGNLAHSLHQVLSDNKMLK